MDFYDPRRFLDGGFHTPSVYPEDHLPGTPPAAPTRAVGRVSMGWTEHPEAQVSPEVGEQENLLSAYGAEVDKALGQYTGNLAGITQAHSDGLQYARQYQQGRQSMHEVLSATGVAVTRAMDTAGAVLTDVMDRYGTSLKASVAKTVGRTRTDQLINMVLAGMADPNDLDPWNKLDEVENATTREALAGVIDCEAHKLLKREMVMHGMTSSDSKFAEVWSKLRPQALPMMQASLDGQLMRAQNGMVIELLEHPSRPADIEVGFVRSIYAIGLYASPAARELIPRAREARLAREAERYAGLHGADSRPVARIVSFLSPTLREHMRESLAEITQAVHKPTE